ncbi:MAG: cyclic nucleotide-gated ion channel, partial [Gammaproteobacteria bacterium]
VNFLIESIPNMKVFEKYFDDFIGYLIILNVIHQILISGYPLSDYLLTLSENFILFSFGIFIFEAIFRIFKERKFSTLLLIDIIVIFNYLFISIFDLRIFRIFRAYSIFSQLRVLLPTNTLLKTIWKQRLSILGTQIVVFSLLLIFSVVIHFLEKDLQPEAFGNILDSMWYGIATLTTVGYGDVTPVSDLGKLISSFAMFLGIAMFALPAAILASAYYEDIQKRNFLVSLEAITEINLFSNLPIGAITKINSKLEPLVLPAKQIIFEKGDIADALYIIEFGSVQVEIETPVVLGSGDYFGETGLISQAERNATISVLEEAKLLKLSKESLDELTEEYPALFEDLKKSAADRTG